MTPKFKDLSLYSDEELAAWTIAGYCGSGTERRKFLGLRYSKVQSIVNTILRTGNIPVSSAKKTDTSILEKAVKELYNEAGESIIEMIKKKVEE